MRHSDVPTELQPRNRRIYESAKDGAVELGGALLRTLYLPLVLSLLAGWWWHTGPGLAMEWTYTYMFFAHWLLVLFPIWAVIRMVFALIDG